MINKEWSNVNTEGKHKREIYKIRGSKSTTDFYSLFFPHIEGIAVSKVSYINKHFLINC